MKQLPDLFPFFSLDEWVNPCEINAKKINCQPPTLLIFYIGVGWLYISKYLHGGCDVCFWLLLVKLLIELIILFR